MWLKKSWIKKMCFSLMCVDSNWFTKTIEETAMKYFCMPRDDHKSEMAAISEETYSQTVSLGRKLMFT